MIALKKNCFLDRLIVFWDAAMQSEGFSGGVWGETGIPVVAGGVTGICLFSVAGGVKGITP